MIFYTSDLHLGHANVIRFDERPFANIDEMDECIISRWNERVNDEDTVYIIGDVCYRNRLDASWYLRELKGHKILVLGNHDNPILLNKKALACLDQVDKMMQVIDGNKQISLCHYPIAEWNAYFHDSWHIYGHIHNRKEETFEIMRKKEHALNAGCMINNYVPVTFDELVANNKIFKDNVELGRE